VAAATRACAGLPLYPRALRMCEAARDHPSTRQSRHYVEEQKPSL
jgi:hypothetical protein